jgi:hypothetical protein
MSGPLTAWPPGVHPARCFARPFACEPADLGALDSPSTDDPAVVAVQITRLLECCLRDRDGSATAADTTWQWSVPRRRQGLIAIAHATLGASLQALARCNAPGCRNQIELELGLASFDAEAREQVELDVAGKHLVCRMPTGADLEAWAREGRFEAAWLAARLIVEDAPGAADWTSAGLDALAAALEAADPLAALTVPVTCPCCGTGLDVTLDLEPLLLGALREVARETLEDVHRLARAYHWTEAEIVAMPRERRRAYLARLQREAA